MRLLFPIIYYLTLLKALEGFVNLPYGVFHAKSSHQDSLFLSASTATPGTSDGELLRSRRPTPSRTPGTTTSSAGAQIFVCTNKWCREKGADATFATLTFLSDKVPVVPVGCLNRCNKGPNVRVLTPDPSFVEASMIRSVDAVVGLLERHLDMTVNSTSAEVLRLNYEGNVYLRDGDVDRAIDCYNRALECGDLEQEGVLLVMRGTAWLQRAYSYRLKHRDLVKIGAQYLPDAGSVMNMISDLTTPIADSATSKSLLEQSPLDPSPNDDGYNNIYVIYNGPLVLQYKIAFDLLLRLSSMYVDSDLNSQQKWSQIRSGEQLLRKMTFALSMYEHSLMRALDDLLIATVVLPGFAQAWRRAGDTLSELQQFSSAIEYYEVAISLDTALESSIGPTLDKLRIIDKVITNAEMNDVGTDVVQRLIQGALEED